MYAALFLPLVLASTPGPRAPAASLDTTCTTGGFATCASTTVSLKILPDGETAAVIDAGNLQGTKARNVGYKARGDFNLRVPLNLRAARDGRRPRPNRKGEERRRMKADSSERPGPGGEKRAKPDSTGPRTPQ